VTFARAHQLLPEAYLYGFAYVHKHEIDRPAFLDNQWSIVGFRSFFPRAFIYKTPLPFLWFLAFACYAVVARRARWKIKSLFNPLSMLALVYGAFALTSQLNIGHRHILPIYPALFVGSGAVIYLLRNNQRITSAAMVAALLSWQIGESFASRPNYLAYFNEAAGGPSCGYSHLVDSSLDWGQDLPALKSWIDNHESVLNGKPLYLAYFGTADPRWYEINAELISPEGKFARPGTATLRAGVYCISATTLQSVYALEIGPWCAPYEQFYRRALVEIKRDKNSSVAQISNDNATAPAKKMRELERLRFERLCAYLRHQTPLAQVGYSIFVFNVSSDSINQALYGPPAELAQDISVIGF